MAQSTIPPWELVNSEQLQAQLEALAAISEAPPPVVTRILFSEADLKARDFIKAICSKLGLAFREDAVGNLFARWKGKDETLPPVATGSHIDAIPNAGRYDGVVGVLGGLEAFRVLKESGFQPVRSLELIVFTAEEPTRFGIGCLVGVGWRPFEPEISNCTAIKVTDDG